MRAAFEQAVGRQLMSDVPYGVLLSGGLDSSLVAACAARAEARRSRLHSFAIGLDGSPDLAAAEVAAAARRLSAICPRRYCGAKRSSSATESGMAGSTD